VCRIQYLLECHSPIPASTELAADHYIAFVLPEHLMRDPVDHVPKGIIVGVEVAHVEEDQPAERGRVLDVEGCVAGVTEY
jgi:hypothetical protein